jgi:Zn-dependent protease with chaperone function
MEKSKKPDRAKKTTGGAKGSGKRSKQSKTTVSRVKLPGISARAYEHPADRAALTSLHKVPALDSILRTVIGLIGERSIRYLYLASAVRVTDRQFKDINRIYQECLDILDFEERPELYIAQTPIVNAGAVGVDRHFIVLNSGTLNLFTEDELRLIIGHELGHILSDHVLYKTLLGLLLNLSLGQLGIPLGSLAIFGIVAALLEWDRKSELSCDRAGLLCVQDPKVAYTAHMKLAGGNLADQMDVNEFVKQAEDYESGGDLLDGTFKLLNLIGRHHPFHVMRLVETKRWVESGAYAKILSGTYPLRKDDSEASVYTEFSNGAKSYKDATSQSDDPLARFLKEVGGAGASVLEKARGLFGERGRPE